MDDADTDDATNNTSAGATEWYRNAGNADTNV
jgi:hypothetical protein